MEGLLGLKMRRGTIREGGPTMRQRGVRALVPPEWAPMLQETQNLRPWWGLYETGLGLGQAWELGWVPYRCPGRWVPCTQVRNRGRVGGKLSPVLWPLTALPRLAGARAVPL